MGTEATPPAGDQATLGRAVRGSQVVAYLASLVPGGPSHRFLIVCTPRSGSELLVDLLDQLPGVRCLGELLDHEVRWPSRFLDGRARIAGARGADVWGCKVLAQHLLWHESRYGSAEAVLSRLVDDGWQLVLLRRRNVLASALSALHAEQTGLFHLRDHDDPGLDPVDADATTILAWIHAFDEYQRWLEAQVAPLPHAVVTYEDDLADAATQQATVDRLAGVLGATTAPVTSRLRRTAPADPWARVADVEGLRALLGHSRYAHLVDETR
jgi:LPS sulfotransferase NodH